MWYVLEVGSEATVAMTRDREMAEKIQGLADVPCTIRWSIR